MKRSLFTAALVTSMLVSPAIAAQELSDLVKQLTRSTEWVLVDEIQVSFGTHHPQGMYKIDDRFFVSSVEITTPTTRYDEPQDGYDRDPGEGRGWLFEIDANGDLIAEVELGEGDIYHPGGIDYDGESIWVPLAEYRPDSASIVYRVNPETMDAEEAFRFRDHLGGIVSNLEAQTLHTVSWGSRRFYGWPIDALGEVTMADAVPEDEAVPNPAHYIDYQDCQYLGGEEALCSGLVAYNHPRHDEQFRLGGVEIVNLADNRPVHQVPILIWSPSGLPMTQNPFFFEAIEDGIRAYFMPDDDDSTIFVYEAQLN